MRIPKDALQQKTHQNTSTSERQPLDNVDVNSKREGNSKKEKRTEKNQEGYNSEDEMKQKRPRITRTIDDQLLQHVDPATLSRRLSTKNLQIIPMAKDGNCMFRSIADQLFGDADGHHEEVRRRCMDYMQQERDHFSQFVTEDFNTYLNRKRKDATFGNHLELQALSELYNRQILIYTTDENPINIFQDDYKTEYPPFQLSYHYGNHYNSVRNPNNPGFLTGTGLPGTEPGAAERDLMSTAERDSVTDMVVVAAQKASDVELLETDLLQEACKQSEREIHEQMMLDAMKWTSNNSFENGFEDLDADLQLALQMSIQNH